MRVDLHIHTYFSDGTMSPEEVVERAKERGLQAIAIADHNNFKAWDTFEKYAKESGITPIKGVEITAKYKEKDVHLLAYGFRNTEKLLQLITHSDREMNRMSDDLIVALEEAGKGVSVADFENYTYDRKQGGWKGLHYLYDRGLTEKLFDAFKYYREYDCDFTSYDFPQISELCRAIKEAGGVSILAHPAQYFKEFTQDEWLEVLEGIKNEGIDGLEVYYPTHSEGMTELFEWFCKKNNLLMTLGCDDHGEFGKHAKKIPQTIGCLERDLEDFDLSLFEIKKI